MPIIRNEKHIVDKYHNGKSIAFCYHGDKLFYQKYKPIAPTWQYREVEYIESTSGNAYIKTGFTITTKSRCEIRQYCTGSITNGLIGNNGSIWFTAGNYTSVGIGLSSLFCVGTRKGTSITDDNGVHTYYISNGLTKIDDNTNSIAEVSSFSLAHYENNPYADYEFGLGRCNTAYSFNQTGTNRIYSCKLYDGNSIRRDFIPVVRITDGVAGMWDRANGTFYSSASDTEFNHGEYVNTWSEDYKRVEYVESSGTQYIDTNYVRSGSTNKVEVKYTFLNGAGSSTLGNTLYGYSRSLIRTPYITNFGETNVNKLVIYGSGGKWLTFDSARNVAHTSVIETDNTNKTWKFTHDDTVVYNGAFQSGSTTISGVSTTLFAVKNPNDTASTVKEYCSARIHYYKEYDNGTLVRNFIPATREGHAGLFDTIHDVFYVSQTSTELIAGDEVAENVWLQNIL